MLTRYFIIFTSIFSLVASFSILADESSDNPPQILYFTLEPDIVTNIYTPGSKFAYIRLRIELVVNSPKDAQLVDHHQPLIRNTISEILGSQTEKTITSLPGREALRQELIKQINAVLMPEVSKELISDLLFTKYLYEV